MNDLKNMINGYDAPITCPADFNKEVVKVRKIILKVLCIFVLLTPPAVVDSSPARDISFSGVVQHLVLPGNRSRIFLGVYIGREFAKTLPEGIDEISIEGPNGFLPLTIKDFKYIGINREFWATLPGVPAKGDYKITIASGQEFGQIIVSLNQIHQLPVPQSQEIASGEEEEIKAARPVFSWQIPQNEDNLFYQLQIRNSKGKRIYNSSFLPQTTYHRPLENILEPGRSYAWRVRVFDNVSWMRAQNRSQTRWRTFSTSSSLEYEYLPPKANDDGWTTDQATKVGVNLTSLKTLVGAIINNKFKDIYSLLLFKERRLILEEYFNGFGPEDLHLTASVTKSVNSILFGQAMDQGLIESIDQPAWSFFQEYDNAEDAWAKEKIKLRHLLTMTAGLDWDYLSLPLESDKYPTRLMITSDDPIGFILNRKIVALPGEIYNYNDGLAIMIGEIIHRVSNQPVPQFAKEHLFTPLDIERFYWSRTKTGITETQGGLYMRPRDMGKIGQLVLQQGKWKGRQIVSSAWLEESTRQHVRGDSKGYGYQWRMTKLLRSGQSLDIIWASGYGGQKIFIVPVFNAVAVVTSKTLYNPTGGSLAEELFVSYLLPALMGEDQKKTLPNVKLTDPDKLIGCYTNENRVFGGCVVREGEDLFLEIKVMDIEEKIRLRPISQNEIIGISKPFGELSIDLKWSGSGELEQAIFYNGLKSFMMVKVE